MSRLILLGTCLFFAYPSEGWAKRDKDMEWQVFGHYVKEPITFTTTGGGDANYNGSSLGFGTVLRMSTKERYGFGIKGAFSSRKGTNTANGTVTTAGFTETESIAGTIFDVGLRFYALDVYVGIGAAIMPFTVTYSTTAPASTVPTERKYNALGVSLELGIDLFFGQNFYVSPKIEYRTFSAQPSTGAANAERMTNLGFGVGLGVAF